MAGVSTPELAAAVCEAGGLGSIALGAMSVESASESLKTLRSFTDHPFNVNLFCHQPAVPDTEREKKWLTKLTPYFARYNAKPPISLREIYKSALDNDEMIQLLVEQKPKVVSFHFGILKEDQIRALKNIGCILIATATNLEEAKIIERAGIDAIVAQGIEAGGHRGVFDVNSHDPGFTTIELLKVLLEQLTIPIIAAGGIMDGKGIAAILKEGASAAQLGTAFLGCAECTVDEGYHSALFSNPPKLTVITKAISGRPARCIENRFTELGKNIEARVIPDYPIAYDAGKALHAAAKAQGEYGYGAYWAGTGVSLIRNTSAAELISKLIAEMHSE